MAIIEIEMRVILATFFSLSTAVMNRLRIFCTLINMTVNIRKEGLPYFGLHTTNLRLLHVENFMVQLLSNDPYFDLQNGAFSFT